MFPDYLMIPLSDIIPHYVNPSLCISVHIHVFHYVHFIVQCVSSKSVDSVLFDFYHLDNNSFLNFLFLSMNICLYGPMEARRECQAPVAGFTDSCMLDVSPGNELRFSGRQSRTSNF